MDPHEFIEKLVKRLEAARDLPCSCSSLTIQVQGCSCERAEAIKRVKERMNKLQRKVK